MFTDPIKTANTKTQQEQAKWYIRISSQTQLQSGPKKCIHTLT